MAAAVKVVKPESAVLLVAVMVAAMTQITAANIKRLAQIVFYDFKCLDS